jgi:glycosyltransferase involved in cell wall biosynthesis
MPSREPVTGDSDMAAGLDAAPGVRPGMGAADRASARLADGGGDAMAVLAILPARNEEDALPGVLERLRACGISEVLLVDNGSTDRTAIVAAEAGARVLREPIPGYGRACLRALAALEQEPAQAQGPTGPRHDLLLFLDADGSDEVEAVPRLLEPLRSGEADLVIGRRLGTGDAPLRQRGGTGFVVGLARWLHGVRARDLGPFRAIRTGALLDLGMDDPTWGWTLQMQIRAHHAGLRVHEIPVRRGIRQGGTSKISGSLRMSIRVGGRMFWTLIRELWKRPPYGRPS